MSKKKQPVATAWAKSKGLVGAVAYFTIEERLAIRRKAFEADVSVREFIRQSALVMTPEQIQKK